VGKQSESTLQNIEVVSPATLQNLVSAVQEAMNKIQDTVVPEARDTMLAAWTHAQEKADQIVKRANDELAGAVPEVETKERDFREDVGKLMDNINDAMFASLATTQAEMNTGMQELDSLVAQVQAKGEAAGGEMIMFLNAEDAAARKQQEHLVAEGMQVESAAAKELADQKTHISTQEMKIAGFIQQMKANHDKAAAAITRAKEDVAQYSHDNAADIPVSKVVTAVQTAGSRDFARVKAAEALMGENVDALANSTGDAESGVVADTYAAILALQNSMEASDGMQQNGTEMIRQLKSLFAENSHAVQLSVEQFAEQFAANAGGAFSVTTSDALHAIAGVGSAIGGALHDAEQGVGAAAGKAKDDLADQATTLQAQQENATASLQIFTTHTEDQTGATSNELAALGNAESDMEDRAAEEARLFEDEINAIKDELKDALFKTRQQVHKLIYEMKQSHSSGVDMSDFDGEMIQRMTDLQENVSDVKSTLTEAVAAAWRSKEEHKARYQTFEQEARAFLKDMQTYQGYAAEDEKKGMNTFTKALLHARTLVGNAAKEVALENAAIFGNTSNSIRVLSALDARAAAQVNASVEKIETSFGHFDRELARLLELEQYQEDDALRRVKTDIDALNHSVARLRVWRAKTENDNLIWRRKVQQEFESMGEALDLNKLQAEEERAAQQFAVQQAMEHLSTHLGDELGSMSDSAQSQIAKLTAVAGAEIKALMEDKELSDGEKAKRLAEIKERLRREALQVLRSGVVGDVHNAALARRLKAGEDEVLSTVAQITSLRADTSTSKTSLDEDLARLTAEVQQAGAQVPDWSSFVEREDVSYEKAAAEDAAWEKWFSP